MLDFVTTFFATAVRCAMPMFIAALGLVYSERAGIVNIGVEGMMLIGAVLAYVGSYTTGSKWMGLLWAAAGGTFFGLILAFWTISLRVNQTVVGAALNILGAGLATTINRMIFDINAIAPKINSFTAVRIPVLSKIPVIGPMFFSYNVLVYLALLCMPVCHYVLYHTELGLRVRAVGENPRAADTLGINVPRVRYGATLFGGLMAGLAGGYLSIGQLSVFVEDMASGRGFIAIAAVVFGKRNPVGALLASLVFGAGEAVQYKLTAANVDIPFQFAQMIPYVLTILSLIGLVGKTEAPAASGVPYVKE